MPSKSSSVRFAVVGLGHFGQTAVLPAFANAAECATLAALVTGDLEKAAELGPEYGVDTFHYDAFDELMASGDVDAVYIALPNSQHREYTERAARAGVHVLCEKPLAATVDDAVAMVAACRRHQVKLMTAYRLHFEEGNLQAIRLVQSGRIGEPRIFTSIHSSQVEAGNTRLDRGLGGGPLEDIGIYCINAARYLFRAEPEEASAFAVHGSDPRFAEVPETVTAMLRFPPDRLATFICGFGAAGTSEYRVIGTEGVLTMNPAFTWQGDIQQHIKVDGREESHTYEHRDQVAAELLYFAKCVQHDREPEPSGEEGLIDVRIIDALRKSYQEHRPVSLRIPRDDDYPDSSQSIVREPASQPEPVNAAPPSQK